jgi:cell division protein FtsB
MDSGMMERLERSMRKVSELEAENARLREEAAMLKQAVAELKRDMAKLRGIMRARGQEPNPTKLKDALRE